MIALPPPGDGRAAIEIGHGGRASARSFHAAALRDEPEPPGEAASTAALAIENGGSRWSCVRGCRPCALCEARGSWRPEPRRVLLLVTS